MLASPALRSPRTCPSSTRRVPSLHSHHRHERAGPPCVYARVHTRTHVGFTFPFCFPFPSSSFLLVTLQHLSLILVPLSSSVVNESLYLPFFLPFFLCPLRFFSTSFPFAGRSPDLSLSYPTRGLLPLLLLSLSDVLLPTRADAISLPRSPRYHTLRRNSRPLRRQPNKCLSDCLHRHFSATLS